VEEWVGWLEGLGAGREAFSEEALIRPYGGLVRQPFQADFRWPALHGAALLGRQDYYTCRFSTLLEPTLT
jgi:hypothetical protein